MAIHCASEVFSSAIIGPCYTDLKLEISVASSIQIMFIQEKQFVHLLP